MSTYRVIPSKSYQNPDNPDAPGVSIFTSYVPPGYVLTTTGWTIEVTDHRGNVTVGMGKPPFATEKEAEDRVAALRAKQEQDRINREKWFAENA